MIEIKTTWIEKTLSSELKQAMASPWPKTRPMAAPVPDPKRVDRPPELSAKLRKPTTPTKKRYVVPATQVSCYGPRPYEVNGVLMNPGPAKVYMAMIGDATAQQIADNVGLCRSSVSEHLNALLMIKMVMIVGHTNNQAPVWRKVS